MPKGPDNPIKELVPSRNHAAISASATALDPQPHYIYCEEAGTMTVEDEDGTQLDYTMVAGAILPFRAVKVTAIASGTFYAWW